MFRITFLTAGLLLSLNVAGLACASSDCAQVKPQDIKQFMREQAASTRGQMLRGTQSAVKPSHSTWAKQRQVSVRDHSATPHVGSSSRRRSTTYAARNLSKNSSPRISAALRPKHNLAPQGAAALEAPSVMVVSDDQYNSIDQTAPAFDAITPPADSSARLIVAEAFAELDGKPEGSLEATDLLGAEERMKVDQSPSWLRWIWSSIGNRFSGTTSATPRRRGE